MAGVSADEARAIVEEALEARRARPGPKLSLGLALTRPLDLETSSGLLIGLVIGAAALAVYFGVEGGALGWILAALAAVGAVLAALTALAGIWHDLRRIRHSARVGRLSDRLFEVIDESEAGAADPARGAVFRQAIVEGSLFSAATAIWLYFRELAGQDSLDGEIAQMREPVWPAWTYFRALRLKASGDAALSKSHLEETLATGHPVWATAAAVELLDELDESDDRERVEELTEWVVKRGDPAVGTELIFYGSRRD
jgi:hypothetical protein